MYDLTEIPCEHAIAAIHDRRHHPIDYVSDLYKKEKFLASYNFPLEALKGEEFWEIHSTMSYFHQIFQKNSAENQKEWGEMNIGKVAIGVNHHKQGLFCKDIATKELCIAACVASQHIEKLIVHPRIGNLMKKLI